jgi:DUF4097 and DUF4098 domain-containing protein YvlB
MMRKHILVCLIALALFALPLTAQDEETISFDVTNRPVVKFSNVIGDLEITAWDKPQIEVSYKKYATGKHAEEMLKLLKVSVSNSGDTVIVDVAYPSKSQVKRSWEKSAKTLGVDFEIKAPANTRVSVNRLVVGDVDIEGFSGNVSVGMVTGDLTGKNISGNVMVSHVSGDVNINGLHGVSEISLTTGSIELEEVTGELTVQLTTGEVSIEAIDLEGLEIDCTSGDIEVDVESAVTFGIFSINVMTGDISLSIAESSAFSLIAKSTNGSIQSDFPFEVVRSIMKSSLKGEYNEGGASITISSFTGGIEVNKN